ncbi:MAG: hypothetical protein QOJ41_1869, partial [Acidobacteriaceae bacterium]|nr:hypothetical protein [Acidobacteriaceae bacterium]
WLLSSKNANPNGAATPNDADAKNPPGESHV